MAITTESGTKQTIPTGVDKLWFLSRSAFVQAVPFVCPSLTSRYHAKTNANIGSRGFQDQVAHGLLVLRQRRSYHRTTGSSFIHFYSASSGKSYIGINGEKSQTFDQTSLGPTQVYLGNDRRHVTVEG